jgi:sulfatase modifying factor 1
LKIKLYYTKSTPSEILNKCGNWNKRICSNVLLCLSVFVISCGSIQTGDRFDPEPIQKSLFDVDPETGVQYYLDADLVQEFPLPNGVVTKMILIPGGEFIMGLNDEDPLGIQPSGNIRIAVNSFWIDQFEVTNAQYRMYLATLPKDEQSEMRPDSIAWESQVGGVQWSLYFYDEGYANYPVVCLNWYQAKKYAEWAGKRLPSEAEWEFAARSGVSGRTYPWEGIYSRNARNGDALANFASGGDYSLDGYVLTAPVGAFAPNNFRLYDMAGNVSEWCMDSYFASYKVLKMATKQLITPTYNSPLELRKVVRGGSWASNEYFIGVGVRDYRYAAHASPRIGLRLAMEATNPIMQKRAREGYLTRTGQMLNPNRVEYTKPQPTPEEIRAARKKNPFYRFWDSITNVFSRKKPEQTNTGNQ